MRKSFWENKVLFPAILALLILLSGCTQNQAELKAPELQDCKNNESECLYENSQLEQSIGICNNVIDSERKFLCYSLLESPLECENLGGNKGDYCYYMQVEPKRDLHVCDSLSDQWLKDSCYLKFVGVKQKNNECFKLGINERTACFENALENKGISNCELIKNIDTKDSCIHVIGEVNKDFSVCSKIESKEKETSCYYTVAEATQNPDACAGVADLQKKDYCYYFVADLRKDPGICDNIAEEWQKANCKAITFK